MIAKTQQLKRLITIAIPAKLLGASLIGLALVACSGSNVSDLHEYVNQVKAKKAGKIPELPDVQSYATYAYQDTTLRDPFMPSAPKRTLSNNGLRPDVSRQRQILEQFPLDTLKMVGSLEQSGERWALIKAQDGTLYRTKPGKFMGQDNGKILRISENEVVLQEIVPDGLGGWVRRQATLSVSE